MSISKWPVFKTQFSETEMLLFELFHPGLHDCIISSGQQTADSIYTCSYK